MARPQIVGGPYSIVIYRTWVPVFTGITMASSGHMREMKMG